MTARSGNWIPPLGLVFGQCAQAVSFALLLWIALSGAAVDAFAGLAWLHLVALGWLTMVALSVLVHVIPAFTDATWRYENVARRSLVVFALGVVALVTAFALGAVAALPWAGGVLLAGLTGYLIPAGLTLAGVLRGPALEAAIGRALAMTLSCLILAAALGFAFTLALNGHAPAGLLAVAPPIHAELGLIGWLTLLAMGVSARTAGPITGGRSKSPRRHVVSAAATGAAIAVLIAGHAFGWELVRDAGTALLALGLGVYVADLAGVIRRATVRHRPPQAFLGAALVWLTAAFVLFVCALANCPNAGAAAVFVMLTGWLGQIVNAHMHHIGVRVLATRFRGDDDETRPGELLAAPLSWLTFGLFQFAVALGAAGILSGIHALLALCALAGLAGCASMGANATGAVGRARTAPVTVSLL